MRSTRKSDGVSSHTDSSRRLYPGSAARFGAALGALARIRCSMNVQLSRDATIESEGNIASD